MANGSQTPFLLLPGHFFFNPKYGPGPELCCVVTLSQVQAWLSFLARVQTESQNWGREGTSVLVRGMGFYIWPRLSRSDFSLRVTFPSSHSRLEAETGWTQTSWVSRAASFHFTVSLSPPHPLNCPPQVPSSRPRPWEIPDSFLTHIQLPPPLAWDRPTPQNQESPFCNPLGP